MSEEIINYLEIREVQEHNKIYEALKAHDEKMAQEAVMAHIVNVRTTINENFSLLV